MLEPPSPFHLRPMQLADLGAVMAIDRLSFATPAKESIYRYDLTENELAHYQVLTLRRSDGTEAVIGYTGYWLMVDEVHISTIAVHPDWRGRQLGELLLLNVLFLACVQGAGMVTLEVRRSNQTAQNLYHKYNFEVVGERRRYYSDGEDALIMTLPLTEKSLCQTLDSRKATLFSRLHSAY